MTADLSSFVGIPYRNRGESFDGCDCWGLVTLFHRVALGRALPPVSYRDAADEAAAAALIRAGWVQWTEVPLAYARRGDVLALRIGKHPTHCGVIFDAERFLHVLEGRTSVLDRFTRGFWRNSIVRVGRWTA